MLILGVRTRLGPIQSLTGSFTPLVTEEFSLLHTPLAQSNGLLVFSPAGLQCAWQPHAQPHWRRCHNLSRGSAAQRPRGLPPKSSVGVADLLADPLGGSEGNAKLTSELSLGRPLLLPLDELLARVASCCPEVIELCLGSISLPERVLIPGSCEAEGRGSGLGLGFEFARERPTTSVR